MIPASVQANQNFLIQPHRKVVFVGDSITDAGRRDLAAPYGNGFVNMVRNMLIARYPAHNLTIVNRGVVGNTVREIAARYEQDVIAERPDWVTIMVGINDVYRQFFGNPVEAVYQFEYQSTLRLLVTRAQNATHAQVILMSPYMIEPNEKVAMRRALDVYGDLMAQVAHETDSIYLNSQAEWDRVLKVSAISFWTSDGFHPYSHGHALLARLWLNAIGFSL